MNRTRSALINSSVASIGQILTLLAQFVSRTFFIHFLGQNYLGLNGLFVNILGFLNFAELGIGSAITYALYLPLANSDKSQISALMMQFKKWYRYIAVVVFLGGILVMPFLPKLVHNGNVGFVNIYFAFFLSLMNTVSSYLVSYKRTLLIANQQGYINVINTVGYSLIQQILQIICLFVYSNFYLYLFIQLFFMVISNVHVSRIVDKMYPYLNDYPNAKINSKILKYFKKNVVGMLSSKVGGIVVNGTDNLLLSLYIGLQAVGFYSNYTLITSGLTNVLNQALSAVSSTVGNLAVVSKNINHKVNVFYKYYALSTVLVLFFSVGLSAFSSTFIYYWIGERYIYSCLPLFLITFNFYLQGIRQPIITYTNAYGLYWYSRYKPIFESVVNLTISVSLLTFTKLGISGVLIGTISSNVLVNLWWEPLIIFKWGLGKGFKKFMYLHVSYILLGGLLIAGTVYDIGFINSSNIILNILVSIILEFIAITLFYAITNYLSPDALIIDKIKLSIKNKIKGDL